MALPTINILNTTVLVYLEQDYPELSSEELDTVARIALANLKNDKDFQERLHDVILNTLQEYIKNRPEDDEETTLLDEVEELRKRANALGFKLQPKYPKIPLHECICGASPKTLHTGHNFDLHGIVVSCPNCGLTSPPTKYRYQAPRAWNNLIRMKSCEKHSESSEIDSNTEIVPSGKDYYSPEEVRAMTQSQVKQNYSVILRSMSEWSKEEL
jgi:hypothetical protein